MIFSADIGNTTVTYSGIERKEDDYEVVFSKRADTVSDKSIAFYRNDVLRVMKNHGFSVSDFEGAVISSVVPSVTPAFAGALRELFKKNPTIITYAANTGLVMVVDHPEKVGNDRLADAAWVADRYALPAVTVDMGTATTFNVIGKGRVFLGGAIAAGVESSLWALSRRAAQLPEIAEAVPNSAIGRNTVECMEVGSVMGAAAMIDGLVARVEKELGERVSLIITGGHAKKVEGLCWHEHVYDPNLLAKGMAYIYDRSKS